MAQNKNECAVWNGGNYRQENANEWEDVVVGVAVVTKRGGQPGNRNAWKSGRYSAENKAKHRYVNALIKRASVAVAEVEKRLPKRKPGPKPASRRLPRAADPASQAGTGAR